MNTIAKCVLKYIVLVMILLLTSCTPTAHWPAANPDDLWVSSEPDIWFVGFDEEKGGAAGQIVSDGEVIEVIMCWGPGPQFDIRRYPIENPDGILVRGECNFSQDEGTVYIIKDIADVLDGAETITFRREDSFPVLTK